MQRTLRIQTISWFWDLYQRQLLDLNPPYQRRSVWNQSYRDYFIDTLLLGYPCPAIFLFQEISPEGISKYNVVDGKQRLETVFSFVQDEAPVYGGATISEYRDRYFKDLTAEVRSQFYAYEFLVEFIPTTDERIVSNIFDRINRNVARLSRQELRHAKYSGLFISTAENLAAFMSDSLPQNFPNITRQSRRQMKDVELVAELLLLTEIGVVSYSQDALDKEFVERDEEWEWQTETERSFREVIAKIRKLLKSEDGEFLSKSRLRNQADFYSFFGAMLDINAAGNKLTRKSVRNLREFIETVIDDEERFRDGRASDYYEAARSASNDPGPRRARIEIIKQVLIEG